MATTKIPKDEANYRPREKSGVGWLRHCGDCVMYLAPAVPPYSGGCTLVQGDISADSVCDYWQAL